MNICLEGDLATSLLLNTPVLARLNMHLTSHNWEIRKMSAENLGSISYNVMGKRATIEAESIPPLCDMLTDQIFEVRASAVRALASLAQLKEGKIQIYDLDKLNQIIELLYDLDEQTRLNTVQLIAACAEYPPSREKFKQCLAKLKEMAEKMVNSQPLVATHAEIAV
jgi:HEAT repeat protein